MYYQLPNGKVVHISVEEYLNLKDRDVQYLLSINAGEYISNPWSGSSISKTEEPEIKEEEEEEVNEVETYFEDYFPDDNDIPDEPFEFEIE
jgi:hypothetical protein